MKKKVFSKGLLTLLVAIKLLYLTAFEVTFISIILPLYPMTRHRYKDYETFREKTKTSFFTDIMPDSAKPKYYYHSFVFKRQSGYRVQLSDEDYNRLKEDAQERYLSYEKTWEKTASLHIGDSDDGAAIQSAPYFRDEDIKFINDKLVCSDDGFYLMYDFKLDSSPKHHRAGILFNDDTNEIIEFYIRTAMVE